MAVGGGGVGAVAAQSVAGAVGDVHGAGEGAVKCRGEERSSALAFVSTLCVPTNVSETSVYTEITLFFVQLFPSNDEYSFFVLSIAS